MVDDTSQMSDDEIESLDQFLAGNWYDREEDDDEIIEEIVVSSPEYATNIARVLRKLLAAPTPTEERKSAFIRERVDRVLPEGTQGPLRWLSSMADLLEQLAARQQG